MKEPNRVPPAVPAIGLRPAVPAIGLLSAVLAVGLLAACGPAASGERDKLTVLAAASLKEAYTELEHQFEAGQPGVDVTISFAGSSDLAQQIVNGAPADVFAAANEATMGTVAAAGLVDGQPRVFATNRLQIVTAAGNPEGISSFADLARNDLVLVVCAPQVPCGAATETIEKGTGVTLRPASEEPDVRSVLGKVIAGEADAGLVYATDVRAAGGKVGGVDFPEAATALNAYPIAAVRGAANRDLAARFVAFVLGDAGRKVLAGAGFGEP